MKSTSILRAGGLVLALAGVFALSAGSQPSTKEQIHTEMATLATSKDPADLARLEQLSASLGGDRPVAQGNPAPAGQRGGPVTPPNCVGVVTSATNNTPTAIVDLGTVSPTVNIAGANNFAFIVTLTANITHTFNGDLDITLTSPASTVVTITTDNGGSNDDVFAGTNWADTNGTPTTDFVYANLVTAGSLIPEEAMSAFYGENPNGTWTLTVADDAGADVGTINSWTVSVTALDSTPINVAVAGSNNTPTAIVDLGTVNSNIAIAGADTFLCDANMTTNITHTFNGDLDITLTSPSAAVTTITTDNGGSNDDVFAGTTWDDDGGTPATDFVYANAVTATPLVPEGAMGAFIGSNPNGSWTLTVADDAGADVGTINSWSLNLTTCSCVIPDADLALTKSVATTEVALGCNAVYTLTVTNNGPGTANNTVVTDALPPGSTYVSNDCGAGFASPTLTWNVGNLAAAASATCNVTVTVGPGEYTNNAVATSDQTDPVPANNGAAASFQCGSTVDIPTVSPIGLLILLAGLAVAAVLILRSRS